ncbi:MAG: DUF1648 domain-containing protein [Clostridia bacterium]|nr:DUF1648 domain-containing protein [Clostridia bacterium]
MKFIKWKTLIVTSLVCLLPILLGIALWQKLPSSVPIHFDINNNPDNFASKEFAVFGMPVLMVLLQFICCIITDANSKKHGERKKFEKVVKWIIPFLTVVLQIITFCYAIGYKVDIRRVVSVIVGIILVVIGNYMPKFDYIKNYDLSTEKAKKINRFIGFETVVMGILFFISIFLPPVATVVCLILLVPYAIIGVIYGIKNGRKSS